MNNFSKLAIITGLMFASCSQEPSNQNSQRESIGNSEFREVIKLQRPCPVSSIYNHVMIMTSQDSNHIFTLSSSKTNYIMHAETLEGKPQLRVDIVSRGVAPISYILSLDGDIIGFERGSIISTSRDSQGNYIERANMTSAMYPTDIYRRVDSTIRDISKVMQAKKKQ